MNPHFEMAFGSGPGLPIVIRFDNAQPCRTCGTMRILFVNRFGSTHCGSCDEEINHVGTPSHAA